MIKMKTPRFNELSAPQRRALLVATVLVGAMAVIVAAVIIILVPQANPGAQYGVGANGFRAYMETGSTLGIDKIVTKDEVAAALGTKAKSVGKKQVSDVFNYNGDRGQTLTYPFTRADGKQASIYIDTMQFKSQTALDDAHIYSATAKAKPINGHPAYYMLAQRLGAVTEYRLMVVDGLNAYKFVMDQPNDSVTITEVSAMAVMIKLAQKAQFGLFH